MLGFSALVVCADADNHTNSGSDKATISFNTDFLFLTSKTAPIVDPSGQLAILLVRFSSWALPSAIPHQPCGNTRKRIWLRCWVQDPSPQLGINLETVDHQRYLAD